MQLSYFAPVIASVSISAIAAVVSFILGKSPRFLQLATPGLVALAAGTMLSTSLLHLLPESIEHLSAQTALMLSLITFVAFFFLERLLHWHHCHDEECPEHYTTGYINLLGDSLHNFLDGIVIAAAWAASPTLGIAATLAIAAHELPQEIGDFGVLMHAGWPTRRAILANSAAAATVILGTLVGLPLSTAFPELTPFLLAAAAGSFLYLAAVDLVPELHRRLSGQESFLISTLFIAGILLIPVIGSIVPEVHPEPDHEQIELELHSEEER